MREIGGTQPPAPEPATTALQTKFNEGIALQKQGKLAEAERIYQEVLHHQPNHFGALRLLGVIALRVGQPERAVELFGKAIGLNANIAVTHFDLATALFRLNRTEEALASYDRAIALNPGFAEAHSNRAIVLGRLKRYEAALASYDSAIALTPALALAHNNRSIILLNLGRPAEALASCDRAIAFNPKIVIAHYNRARALEALRRHREALASYDTAIKLMPDFAEANWNKGLCLLQLGNFDEGWRLYEWRKKLRDDPIATRTFLQPLWLGNDDLAGKTLFLWWEQGFGDTIQFSRYAKLFEARRAKVIMSVQEPLRGILKQISPTIQIITESEVPNSFDYHCPLQSVPLAFGTTLETIPAQQPYLKADKQLRAAWAARLPSKTKPRIGLVWSGRAEHKNDHNRSMELAQLSPLLTPEADWICLQKEVREKDVALLHQLGRIAFWGDHLRDFSDTAALLDHMDFVITIDTSVAHLAGAMGKAAWILLPYNPDWRWLLNRDDSPWYPSARLFRQQRIGNWVGVIDQIRSELPSVISR